jgi:hypothetical protein
MSDLGRRYQASAGAASWAVHLATSMQQAAPAGSGGPKEAAAAQAAAGADRHASGSKLGSAASGAVLVHHTQSLVDAIVGRVASTEDVAGARLLRCRVADHCRGGKSVGAMAHRGVAMGVLS